MTRRSNARFWDPAGRRFGIPTWPWRMAPGHLATRRQLAAAGLRPGGQPVAGQVLRHRPRGLLVAYLYDVAFAKPKRVPTTAQLAALDRALAARRTCPRCRTDVGYVLPRRVGACLDCAEPWELEAA
ncbi:RRQRL motif-containing zinc-binding protein [Actinomadura atramentaria]|uniref:RRQRL motif-containing zinc-binding protein n=1 Tax=Actinomadura atramentaria TaxID=1990 RepID=UPI00036A43C7|nr:RRQRL motif-containing zinc-binding protein [Actinomadura atramentaria]